MAEFDAMPGIVGKDGAKFHHIGLLVRDAKKAAEMFDTLLLMEPWDYHEDTFPAEDLQVGAPFKIRVMDSRCGNINIELLEPFDGPGCYMEEWLAKNGEGFHHMAFVYPSYEIYRGVVDRLTSEGYKAVHAAELNGDAVHYFEAKNGGMVFEVKYLHKLKWD